MSKATDHNHNTDGQEQLNQDPDESWAQQMTERRESMVHTERVTPPTIYRVPESIRQADEYSYKPKMISIGPYHYKAKETFRAMEEQKWRNLKRILFQHPGMRLVDFLKEIKICEEEIRNCYSEIICLTSQEIVEMMVLDGCFIVAILLNLEEEVAWDRSHPIYESRWVWPNLVHDILLLENQVPFFVLDRLFHLISKSNSGATDRLLRLGLKFCDGLMPRMEKKKTIPPPESVHHLLHLFHWHHRLSHLDFDNDIPIDFEREPLKMIPPATEITRAGIKLRKDDGDMLNVRFRDNVLLIPTLHLNYQTFSLLRNLIALEQCSFKYGTDFTSYAFFIDCLIDTTEDVALLKRQLIVEHDLSMDEDVALLINRLCSGISFDIRDGYMSNVFREVRRAYIHRWETWTDKLIREYFSKPWDILNFQAGVLSGYLSVMQTVFAALSYRRGS